MARASTYAQASALRPSALFGLAVLFSALAGVLIWLLMDSLSRSSIGGATWSLRGNGALIVPIALGPTTLAMAWVALARSFADGRGWLGVSLAAGLLTLVLELLAAFGPIVLGAEHAATIGLILVAGIPLLAQAAGVALALAWGSFSSRGFLVSGVICLLVIVLNAAMPGVSFFVVPFVVPIVLTGPLVGSRRGNTGWFVASVLAVPVALVGAFFLTQIGLTAS